MRIKSIPLPTNLPPNPTPIRTRRSGVGWRPNQKTSKPANLAMMHAKRYNAVTKNLSILFTRSLHD